MLLSWFIMLLSKKEARLYIFNPPSPPASVAIIDDILMAFWEKCKLCALSRLSRWHLESIKAWIKGSY